MSLSKSVYAQPSVGPRAARVLLAAVLGIAPRKLVEDVLEALISVVW